MQCGPLYFCGAACIGKFAAAPAKYAAGLANSYSYQTKCPVMGGKINPKSFSVLATGETIYYCCNGCDNKLMANPAKYNKSLVAQGVNVDWEKVKAMKDEHGKDDGHGHGHGHEGHDHH